MNETCPLCGEHIDPKDECRTELVEIEPERFALSRMHATCAERRKNGHLFAVPPPRPDPED